MAKIRYTLSDIISDKVGAGCRIEAVPNAYAPTLRINFDNQEEARDWLKRDSPAWLAKLEHAGVKRPRDPSQLAKLITDIATGETANELQPAMSHAERGRLGGRKGGRARADKLSSEERSDAAKKAATARWRQ